MNKDPYVVPEQAYFIILDIKSAVCMSNNGKDTKHTRQISRIMHFVINDEEWNLHKKLWCEGGLKLAYVVTKNVMENEFNPILGYSVVRLDNLQNTFTNRVIGDRRVWITICSEWLDWI